jgi:DNA-binding transcriptional LysR family regulator
MKHLPSGRSFLRQIDLSSLDLFVLICDSGSISAAAQQGHMAISAVSKRVTELERVAGVSLLSRHARGVRPTAAGTTLLRHARSLLLGLEHLRSDLDGFVQGQQGQVRLAASASAVEQFLPTDIAAFHAKNPKIRIDLSQGTTVEVIEAVRRGDADVGVCNPLPGLSDLECHAYQTERLVVVVPNGHALLAYESVTFSMTLDHDQVGLDGSSTIRQLLEQSARQVGGLLRQRIEVASLSAMCRMVEAGLGVGVMPEGVFRQLAKPALTQALPLQDDWALRRMNFYVRKFDALSASAQRFAGHLSACSQ